MNDGRNSIKRKNEEQSELTRNLRKNYPHVFFNKQFFREEKADRSKFVELLYKAYQKNSTDSINERRRNFPF